MQPEIVPITAKKVLFSFKEVKVDNLRLDLKIASTPNMLNKMK
jgi:hypothetical protein